MTTTRRSPVRYAVVGLGYIAQAAVLPAFRHARKNSRLTALVSGDPKKLRKLSRQYEVENTYSYDEYAACLASGTIDAVYIALPNSLHYASVMMAAKAGIHVLCEKPLSVTENESREMIEAARSHKVKLMTAYRLHFDRANLKAISITDSGQIGEPRFFHSVFTRNIEAGNIRLQRDLGGGVLEDLGIYCINAARAHFKAEPVEVQALAASRKDKRFREVDEMVAAVLRFPGERLAVFVSSFGSEATGWYEVVGTRGSLRVEEAYDYTENRTHLLTINEKRKVTRFGINDQFAAELVYFSQCILRDENPVPDGKEGLADVAIIEALHRSSQSGGPVNVNHAEKKTRPTLALAQKRKRSRRPRLYRASTPSR